MLADDDRTENGSKISRLVTTQGASMKEIFRVRKGITAMMPGKTDFCDRTHTQTLDTMHSLYCVCVHSPGLQMAQTHFKCASRYLTCKCVVCAELRLWRSRTL